MSARLVCFVRCCLLISCGVSVLTCTVDEDCSLNGNCNAGSCICYVGWIGAACGQLDLLPAPAPVTNGYNVPNTSSWGAGVLFDPSSGLYHMWAAEFVNHCGLLTWHNNSRVVHATSLISTGPYTFVDETIPVYSHNPTVARTADGRGVILMHIGGGLPDASPSVCVNGSSQSGNITSSSQNGLRLPSTSYSPASVATICASQPSVPFAPCNWTHAPGFTNPTLWVAQPGGDIMTGGNSNYSLVLSRGQNCSNFNCASWPPATEVTPSRTGEDPWIWQDPRRNWHALFHDMSPDLPAGRHAFSRDGVEWVLTEQIAYNGTVAFADGSTTTFSKRERPHLLLDEAGNPSVLFTGVMQYPENIDDHSWTLAQGVRAVSP